MFGVRQCALAALLTVDSFRLIQLAGYAASALAVNADLVGVVALVAVRRQQRVASVGSYTVHQACRAGKSRLLPSRNKNVKSSGSRPRIPPKLHSVVSSLPAQPRSRDSPPMDSDFRQAHLSQLEELSLTLGVCVSDARVEDSPNRTIGTVS